eukprot:SAG11_NODE_31658_length_290_cov_0.764398_1_plen_22_part_10
MLTQYQLVLGSEYLSTEGTTTR